jgi:hypothetical protein
MTTSIQTKERFIKQLKQLKQLPLAKHQYMIWGSGPLAIRGIRESKDIDLVVTKQIWDQLAKRFSPSTSMKICTGNIEIWNDCLNLTDQIDDMIAKPDIIEGFPFMTLRHTIEWKRQMNRDKDLKDIALIEAFLKSR